jgi:hypothetical protein
MKSLRSAGAIGLSLLQTNERATLTIVARDSRAGHQANEETMRRLLFIIGLLALAVGLLWIGQGTGYIAWPQSSFMISQIQWAYYGAALAVVGLILIWQGRR